MCEKYEGWANRETWCMNLWLNNDEGLYNECMRLARRSSSNFMLADEIKDFAKELFDGSDENETIKTWKDDVGSVWRVDWVEIADGFMED